MVATVSPLHVASTCAVPAPAPAPGGHSCVFWKMGFGFFSNKNLFKKIHESESPLIPVGTPEEGKPALQPPHPSSTQGEAANTFGEGPAPAWGTPQDQRAEKSLGGWGQWPGCHTCMPCASTPSQQHFGLPATPLPCSHPCSFCDKSKRGHREVPRDHRLLSPSPRGPTGRWGQQPGDATWTPQPMAFGFWSEVFICWGGAAVVVTLLRTPQTNPLGTVVTRYVGYPKGRGGPHPARAAHLQVARRRPGDRTDARTRPCPHILAELRPWEKRGIGTTGFGLGRGWRDPAC